MPHDPAPTSPPLARLLDDVASRLDQPTARGLAGALSRAIGDGVVVPGVKLPPIRQVAGHLGLSPTTVSAAWQLLARSGAIHSDGRRGTVVAEPRATGPRRYRRALGPRTAFPLDLSTGVPDPALLPDLAPALRRLPAVAPGSYLDKPVVADLEAVLRARWPAPVQRLTMVDGAMDGLDRVASTLLRLGDRAVVEDPCFPPLLDLLDALGVEVIGVALDRYGVVPQALAAALSHRPAAFFVQPRAHNPTGASWTPERVDQVADVLAASPSTVVIEDDSAGDIAMSPLCTLGARLPDRTVHMRSFSKSHGPDLRLAALAGPAALLDPVIERRLLGQGWTSRLLQYLLLDLLTDPASVTAVNRARREYARRRRLVADGLSQAGIDTPPGDGINLWLPVADEQAAVLSLASAGIGAAAGAAFAPARVPSRPGHLRITVGLVTHDHAEVARRLATAAGAGPWTGPR